MTSSILLARQRNKTQLSCGPPSHALWQWWSASAHVRAAVFSLYDACMVAAAGRGAGGGAGGAHDTERHAARMAVQAGAGALISLTAGACDDIVMCSRPRLPGEHPADSNGDSLLVLAAPGALAAAVLLNC